MTDEGNFNKADGNVLYASEVNGMVAMNFKNAMNTLNQENQVLVPFAHADGNVTLTRGAPYLFSDFDFTGGSILTDGPGGSPLVIFVKGNSLVDGLIDLAGGDGGNASAGVAGVAGSVCGFPGGIGGLDEGATSGNGSDFRIDWSTYFRGSGGKGPAQSTSAGGPAGSYLKVSSTSLAPGSNFTIFNAVPGAGGGGGGGEGAGSYDGSAGGGGAGGGTLILVTAGSLTVNGKVDVKGGAGGNGAAENNYAGGGGGGGNGGTIVLAHGEGFTDNGTYDVDGGLGGTAGSSSSIAPGGGGGSGEGSNGTAGENGNEHGTPETGNGGDGGSGATFSFTLNT